VHIYPENGGSSGFAPGNAVRIVIPTGNREEYLNTRMSYLKLRLTNADPETATGLTLDLTAHSLIRSLKVSASRGAGGGVLENVEDYNALLRALSDTNVSQDQRDNGSSVAEGSTTGGNIFGGNSRIFCLSLMSSVLGTRQQKYLPTGAMARTHLDLELTLAERDRVQFGSAPWTVSDVEFVAETIHLDPAVDHAIAEANSQGIVVPFHTYNQHRRISQSGSGSMSMSFSSPFHSLKTLLAIFCRALPSYDNVFYVSTRTNPVGDTGRWQLSINGVHTPNKEVGSNAES
jgi:hypothetical protein